MSTNATAVRLTAGGLAVLVVAVVVWAAARGAGNDAGPIPTTDPHAAHEAMDHEAMDHVAMGHGDSGGSSVVRLDPRTARSLGVTVVAAELGPVRRQVRTTGNVTYDETRRSTVAPKIGGFVEQLHVNFTGQAVRRGEPLLEIYSPELVAAQEELLAAVRLERQLATSVAPGVGERAAGLVEAARRRLLLWDISPEQVHRLEETGEVRRTMTLHAPFTGFVVEKDVVAGQAVQQGQALYRLADLSQVWVEADLYEQDLALARVGESARIEIAAFAGERFTGRVGYVYPDVRPRTRTGRVRVQLPNPEGRIKPGMFATVYLEAPGEERAVLVPRDAVMRTGTRDLVFVEAGAGVYEAREVRVGTAAADRLPVLSGLEAGERVVARANFILDAESRLMETMMGQPGMPGMEMDGHGGHAPEMPGMEMDGHGGHAPGMPGMDLDAPGAHH